MIAFEATHDGLLAAVVVAAISGVTSVVVTYMNRRSAAAGFSKIGQGLDTGNGHTIGAAIARIEEQNHEILDRLDRVETKVHQWEEE